MKKKSNIVKRNSGFLIGCVLAAGASFFTADMVMTDKLGVLTSLTEAGEQPEASTETLATIAPESDAARVFETDPFTVTAAGNIIKGVETEPPVVRPVNPVEPQTDENGNVIPETDADGNVIPQTDADGNVISSSDGTGGSSSDGSGGSYDGSDDGSYGGGDSGYYDDGSSGGDSGYYDDGSSGGDGGYYEQPVEINDPGNGDYSYSDGGSGDGSGGGSDWTPSEDPGNNDSAWTPDDVIIQGISSRYIDESELYNYNAGQLRLIRNEIFALHGRIFNSPDLAEYFSQKSWYVPTYSPEEFDENMFYYLNDYEEANLEVILNYEDALAAAN